MIVCTAGDAERICSACRESKPLDQFTIRSARTGKRNTQCTPCRQAYDRAYYARNESRRLKLRQNETARQAVIRGIVAERLSVAACEGCSSTEGLRYHRSSGRSVQDLASAACSVATLEKAIAASRILCVTCTSQCPGRPTIDSQMTESEKAVARAAVERALEGFGGLKVFADKLNLTAPAVYHWVELGRIPERRVAQVSALTGIPAVEIRPDLFRAPA